jgi:nucleotide-binding universal stress UspA family protein
MKCHSQNAALSRVKRSSAVYQRIVLAFDGSESARRALDVALHLARADKVKLTLIFVAEMPRYPGAPSETKEEQDRADVIFQELRGAVMETAREYGVEVTAEKRVGHPAQALVHYVRDAGVQLLVMGHTGHSKLWGTFMGTTADKVVRHAPCSVLVVR